MENQAMTNPHVPVGARGAGALPAEERAGTRRLRVLILANDCNPEWPSLPVVGYKAARALAEHADVVVATHVRNRPAIERHGFGRAEIAWIDNEYIAAPTYRFARWLRGGDAVAWSANIAFNAPVLIVYEWEVWRRFKKDLKAGRFDVVHRLTPMSPAIPSPMARWSPVPFVLGPLNGGLRWPTEFQRERRKEREWLTYVRNAYRAMPYYRSTYRRSAAIMAAFPHTIADLPARERERMIDFPEVGIDPELFAAPEARPARDRVEFLFAGRLVPYKCADVAIRAMAARESLRRHRLLILGQGPERALLEGLVHELKLEGCVEVAGGKTQAQVGQAMRTADVFVFPSIRELGAGVVVEAMACGMPSVVVDYGGPGGLIDADRGIKVALGSKAELVERFAEAMERLAQDGEMRRRLGCAAHEYALREYSWDAKARKIVEVYRWALGQRAEKPVFEMHK
jgi:glycosyltransferase involved in cell wall biosynthesis